MDTLCIRHRGGQHACTICVPYATNENYANNKEEHPKVARLAKYNLGVGVLDYKMLKAPLI